MKKKIAALSEISCLENQEKQLSNKKVLNLTCDPKEKGFYALVTKRNYVCIKLNDKTAVFFP